MINVHQISGFCPATKAKTTDFERLFHVLLLLNGVRYMSIESALSNNDRTCNVLINFSPPGPSLQSRWQRNLSFQEKENIIKIPICVLLSLYHKCAPLKGSCRKGEVRSYVMVFSIQIKIADFKSLPVDTL